MSIPDAFVVPTPLGPARAVLNADGALAAFSVHDPESERIAGLAPAATEAALRVAREVEAYFAGTLTRFTLPLAPVGTAFQQRVWTALREIPFGQTTTYGALARDLGSPGAMRAVGAANGANPIWLIVPCHRVLGAQGLHGYAGGLARKAWLLRHEGVAVPETWQQTLALD